MLVSKFEPHVGGKLLGVPNGLSFSCFVDMFNGEPGEVGVRLCIV